MIYIVKNPRSNFFINDLLVKISECLNNLGIHNELTNGEFPDDFSSKYLFVPHEWIDATGITKLPSRKILARSVGIITENPGSPWFEECTKYSGHFPRFLFINKSALEAFPVSRRKKLQLQLFNLTSTEDISFEEWTRRKYMFAFVGGSDPIRRAKIATLSQTLSKDKSFIHLPETKLSPTPTEGQVSSPDFEKLLHDTKILINIHRDGCNSIEWQRVLTAISAGTVVFSEPSVGTESKWLPWLVKEFDSAKSFSSAIPSEHQLYEFMKQASLVSAELRLSNDEDELKKILSKSVNLRHLLIPHYLRRPRAHLSRKRKYLQIRLFEKLYSIRWLIPEYKQVFQAFENITSAQKSLALESIRLRRRLEDLSLPTSSKEKEFEIIGENLRSEEPLLTIGITIYNEGELLKKCIDSIKNLKIEQNFDVLVCSDAGNQESLDIALQELRMSELSFKIVRRIRNGGVGASRNTMLNLSRGQYFLILDGDNSLFPKGPQHLIDALASDANAHFAYGLLAVNQGGRFVDIMNSVDWDSRNFSKVGNFIDALTLVNRKKILAMGGFSESLNLYGWEDFDLWARVAHQGGYGVQVKNFVAVYFKRANSMISTTNISARSALAEIKERSASIWS